MIMRRFNNKQVFPSYRFNGQFTFAPPQWVARAGTLLAKTPPLLPLAVGNPSSPTLILSYYFFRTLKVRDNRRSPGSRY